MKESISIKVTEEKLNQMKDFYHDFLLDNNGEYVHFDALIHGIRVTGYSSNKTIKKVTFIGENASKEASIWKEEIIINTQKEKTPSKWVDINDQIGSDEVGVGDLLCPMIVVATYVTQSDITFLKSLGVDDSKKISDIKIKEIAPVLIKNIEYSKLTLSNDKYNEMIEKGENINSLKAKMHNRALSNLVNKHPDTVGVYVDQFVSKEKFYEYLNDKNEQIVYGIAFKTKGESSFPSVAAASIIARYAFLEEVETLNKKYKTEIPFGASSKVDQFVMHFIEKYGVTELTKIAKMNFKNLKNLNYSPPNHT